MRDNRYALSAFPVDDDQVVDQWPLRGVSLDEMRVMFDRPGNDPMVEEYRVSPRHVEWIERVIGQPLDLDRFEYFVGPVAEE